ncbi:MAG TPA: c-type cytochrome [Myxococcota bacterium]|nr:c-type cytochrome [Myxococcota bacterium]HND29000.1 c-type cytochrome [Myxococcota bacterium]
MAKPTRRWWLLGGLLLAGVARAFPWDIDMVDSVNFKAFEWRMAPAKVEGTVQRSGAAVTRPGTSGAYQNDYIAQADRMAPETAALSNPYAGDAQAMAKGEHLFQVSCAPCHGVKGAGGGPVTHNEPNADIKKAIRRFAMPAPNLSGPGAASALRTDGYIYLTIRNGGAGMPAYGVSLTDQERWAIVSYIRTLDGAVYVPPAPVEPPPTAVVTP